MADSLFVVVWSQLASDICLTIANNPSMMTLQESTSFGHYLLRAVTDLNGDGSHELVFGEAIDAVDERIFVHVERGCFATLARHYCSNCQQCPSCGDSPHLGS